MADSFVPAVAALLTAVLAAAWQIGGVGALTRRTIKQELEIADALPVDLVARQRLEQLAYERTTLYVYAQTTRGLSPSARRRLVVLTLAAPALLVLLWIAWGYTPLDSPAETVVSTALAFDAFLMAALVGFWTGHGIFVRFGGNRRERDLEIARAALGQAE